ncbi:unnamed protein product [Caenorhabditis bovis]|uniref:Uncharacterized protein n=1 Tax=Caenorhabditis bovis TaxID=2654633 RepID=A0A8S1EXX4_9PELO|nr:unnamed protein product [Caenorhabditis bovis]
MHRHVTNFQRNHVTISRNISFNPIDESIPEIDETDATSMTSSHGYLRVDSNDVASLMDDDDDNPNEALFRPNNEDYASTYHHDGIDYDSYDELERHELDDRLGEIPQEFHRRQRREALFGEEVTRAGLGRAEYYEDHPLIHTCEKSGHEELDESDEASKDEDEEEEEAGIRKYAKLILPHVALVLLTCAYTVLGASIFYSVERPHEQLMKTQQVHQ